MKKKGILERLKGGPVLGDGGYLLELEKRGWVRAGPFTPEVVLTHPDALRELHVEFREAGAEVLQVLRQPRQACPCKSRESFGRLQPVCGSDCPRGRGRPLPGRRRPEFDMDVRAGKSVRG